MSMSLIMETNTSANLRMARRMDKEPILITMVESRKANIRMTRRMDKEHILGPVVQNR